MVRNDRVNEGCRMSVLIKGMKMPEDCFSCPLKEEGFCNITNAYAAQIYKRNSDCPLVELPEHHGRLIDEQEIRNGMNRVLTQPQRPTWDDTYEAIEEMNATIEAE